MAQNFFGLRRDTEGISETLSSGLVFFARPGDAADRVSGTSITKQGSMGDDVMANGRRCWYADADGEYLQCIEAPITSTTKEYTYAFVIAAMPDGTNTTNDFVSLSYSSGTTRGQSFNYNNSTGKFVSASNPHAGDASFTALTTNPTDSVVLVRVNPGNSGETELWIDGVLQERIAWTETYTGTAVDRVHLLGSVENTNYTAIGAKVAGFAIWSRPLLYNEIPLVTKDVLGGPTNTVSMLNPTMWIVAPETTDRVDGTAITLNGTTTTTTYHQRDAWSIEAAGDSLQLLKLPLTPTTSRDWTVSFVIGDMPTADVSYSTMFVQCNNSSSTISNHTVFYYDTTGAVSIDENSPIGSWTAFSTFSRVPADSVLTVVHSSDGNAYLYVDGTLYSTIAHTEVYSGGSPTMVQIGRRYSSSYEAASWKFHGVMAFNAALTADQVASLTVENMLETLDRPYVSAHQVSGGPVVRYTGPQASDTSATFTTSNTVSSNGITLHKQEQWNDKKVWVPGFDTPAASQLLTEDSVVFTWTADLGASTNWTQGGTWASNDNYLYNSTHADGDYTEYSYSSATVGRRYYVLFTLMHSSDRAIVDVTIAGSAVLTGLDPDAASNNYGVTYRTDWATATASTLPIRWTANGTTGTDHYIGLYNFQIIEATPTTEALPAIVQVQAQPEVMMYVQYTGSDLASDTNPILWDRVGTDLTGSYDTSTGIFIVPSNGYYEVRSFGSLTANETAGAAVRIYVDSVEKAKSFRNETSNYWVSYAVEWGGYLTVGQEVTVGFDEIAAVANFRGRDPPENGFIVRKVGQPYVTAPSVPQCLVQASLNSTGGTVTGSSQIIIFNEKAVDLGGDYSDSTGIFTAPFSGYFKFSVYGLLDSTESQIHIRKGGVEQKGSHSNQTETWENISLIHAMFMNSGETADVYLDYTSGGFYGGGTGSDTFNGLTIEHVGAPPAVTSLVTAGEEAGIPLPTIVHRWYPTNLGASPVSNWTKSTGTAWSEIDNYITPNVNTQYAWMQFTHTDAIVGRKYRFHWGTIPSTNRADSTITVDGQFDHVTIQEGGGDMVEITGWYTASSSSINVRFTANSSGVSSYYQYCTFLWVEEAKPYSDISSGAITVLPTPDVLVHARFSADITSTDQIIAWDDVQADLGGNLSGDDKTFTAPNTGYYEVTAKGLANTGDHLLYLRKNSGGTTTATDGTLLDSSMAQDGSGVLSSWHLQWSGLLNAGDTVDVLLDVGTGEVFGSSGALSNDNSNAFIVKKIGAPAVTAHSVPETAVHYHYTNSQATGDYATDGTIIWDTKTTDLGADYNASTGEYTVPTTGVYEVEASVLAKDSTSDGYVSIRVNGNVEDSKHVDATAFDSYHLQLIKLLTAGDVVTIYQTTNVTIAGGYDATEAPNGTNSFSVKQLGQPPTVTQSGDPNSWAFFEMTADKATSAATYTEIDTWELTSQSNDAPISLDSSLTFRVSAAAQGQYSIFANICFQDTNSDSRYVLVGLYENGVLKRYTYGSYEWDSSNWYCTVPFHIIWDMKHGYSYTIVVRTENASNVVHSGNELRPNVTFRRMDVSPVVVAPPADPECLVMAKFDSGTASADPIVFNNVTYNIGGAYNNSTGEFTVPSTGYYKIAAWAVHTATGNTIALEIDGIDTIYNSYSASTYENRSIDVVHYLTQGQVVTIAHNAGNISSNHNGLHIRKVGAPAVTAHSVPACAVHAIDLGGNMSSSDVIVFDTKNTDVGGHYNTSTGEFTVPTTGYYDIHAYTKMGSSSGTLAAGGRITLRVNGTALASGYGSVTDTSTFVPVQVKGVYYLTVADTVDIYWTKVGNGVVSSNTSLATADNGFIVKQVGAPSTITAPAIKVGYVRHVTSGSTQGGTATSGAWTTRVMNTVVDTWSIGITLSSNEFTLPAGNFELIGIQHNHQLTRMNLRFWNVDSSEQLGTQGLTAYAASGDTTNALAIVNWSGTLVTATTIRLEYRVTSSIDDNDLGVTAIDTGIDVIHAEVKITKF